MLRPVAKNKNKKSPSSRLYHDENKVSDDESRPDGDNKGRSRSCFMRRCCVVSWAAAATTTWRQQIRRNFQFNALVVRQFAVVSFLFILVLLLLLLGQRRQWINLVVDDLLFRYGLDQLLEKADSTTTLSWNKQPLPTLHWPTVEMRSRKIVENYRNVYLQAVLERKEDSSSHQDVLPKNNRDTAAYRSKAEWILDASSWNDVDADKWWQINSVQARLERAHCQSTWWCRRCLAFPLATGSSLDQCQCATCHVQVLQERLDVPTISGAWRRPATDHGVVAQIDIDTTRAIPRIIHHIGRFQELPTMLSHPDWIRTQNTWRSQSGFEYHPYATIKQQRRWINHNYPSMIRDAFDFLQGDSRQAALFALLVLFRKGGIAVYMDVMLEVQLDKLFSSSTQSFLGAVDSRCVPYRSCLYPGLVASAPGHSIVGHAIEALLHVAAVESHAPTYETDEVVAYLRRFFPVESLEIWRTRFAKDICPIAVAVHRYLGNQFPYLPLNFGIVPLRGEEEALFLLMSANDTGATRISDIGRNLLVASTDLQGWTSKPVSQRSETNVRLKQGTTVGRNYTRAKLLVPVEFVMTADST